ncbi:REP element-mobilizing transposase RayT [Algoriphagus hitonicola]|uniref:REP element-mobilizing transposase RayT n=1 Tax=Algoriphagus hitonicola TaxID=435880 RepID=A0A1I2R1N1_9BACT|nr:REP element-mobilizing transposase RayT [Algoriphagus hitonicola]
MPQSLSKVYLHIVFSTKNRVNLIPEETRSNAEAYFVKVSSNLGSYTEEIYIMPNHVHWLCTLPRVLSISELIQKIKISSSAKIKEFGIPNFTWQKGYGVFSVSQSRLESVKKYIQNQSEHHKKFDFQTEYRTFLKKYKIEYDEEYLWD